MPKTTKLNPRSWEVTSRGYEVILPVYFAKSDFLPVGMDNSTAFRFRFDWSAIAQKLERIELPDGGQFTGVIPSASNLVNIDFLFHSSPAPRVLNNLKAEVTDVLEKEMLAQASNFLKNLNAAKRQ